VIVEPRLYLGSVTGTEPLYVAPAIWVPLPIVSGLCRFSAKILDLAKCRRLKQVELLLARTLRP
jgi:hypothetical protein